LAAVVVLPRDFLGGLERIRICGGRLEGVDCRWVVKKGVDSIYGVEQRWVVYK